MSAEYTVRQPEEALWTVGFVSPYDNTWIPESDHDDEGEADRRAADLNGSFEGFVYLRTEPGLWTVGYYPGAGRFEPVEDFGSEQEAADEVIRLNA